MSVFFIRRWILTFLIVIGIVFIVSVLRKKPGEDPDSTEIGPDTFEWIDVENLTEFRQCRNSVQGQVLIVDERGFLCKRADLSASGCCHSDGVSTYRFYCKSCQLNNCCSVYEHCVSCCLDPKKKKLLLELLSVWRAAPNVFTKSISDQFQLCLTKCRTSSKELLRQGHVEECMTSKMRSGTHPYGLVWLDSCHQQTLHPGSPWQQLQDVINKELSKRLEQVKSEEERQMILDKLGQKFIDSYWHSPPLDQGVANTTHTEPLSWIKQQIQDITKELGLLPHQQESARVAQEFTLFNQQIKYNSMALELSKADKEQANGSSFLPISGAQSESLGNAVRSVLVTHPDRLSRVCQMLTGRQLPNGLRQLIWRWKIYRAHGLITIKDIQSLITDAGKAFTDTVELGERELGLANLHHSPVDGVIQHAVEEIYNSSPAIRDLQMMKTCSYKAKQVLNILYIHNRSYEPHHALLLLPLIWTYNMPHYDVTSVHLAEMLFYLMKHCFPSRLEVLSAADRAVSRLQQDDPDLYHHLCKAMQCGVEGEQRDFLLHFLHTEREQALATDTTDSPTVDMEGLLTNPLIFVRKWIGQGFAGVLDLPSTLFVWDQCFLSDWNSDVLVNMCLVLVELLRDPLLHATDYHMVKRVLMTHPSTLYTADIQQTLMYISNGGTLVDVANLNQRGATPGPASPSPGSVSPSPAGIASGSHSSTSITAPAEPSASTLAHSASPSLSPDLGELWIEQIRPPSHEPLDNTHAFDIYIDQVRFISDNATVIKVTGRILDPLWRKPVTLDVPDIEAFSLLDSPARCPKFHFRHRVGSPATGIPTDTYLLLRVYTINVTSAELLVIGNCILKLYTEQRNGHVLNTGGYQYRLTHQLPSTGDQLSEAAFHDKPCVPAITLLVRILPHTQEFAEAPSYMSGYYESRRCLPNESEWRLYQHYKTLEPYPPSVREAIRDIVEEEEEQPANPTDETMNEWYRRRMSKTQLQGKPANGIDVREIVQYDQKQGMFIIVDQAFGLPGAHYVNVLMHTSEGPSGRLLGKTDSGYGGEEKALIQTRDFGSMQGAPRWIDQPKLFHPHYDKLSSLIIRLYSLDATYEPLADRTGPGTVVERRRKGLASQGWTVLPLFYRKSVNVGLHRFPLFQGLPSPTFLEFLSTHDGETSLKEAIRQNVHQLQGSSSIAVRLWDGHFAEEDCIPLPVNEEMLSLGKPAKYKKTMQVMSGKRLADLVLQCLTKQERKLGTNGQPYQTEKDNYEQTMNSTFTNKLDDTLLQLGLGPLDT